MKKLIVNADDFGLTEGVNRAIIHGHRNGIITSATLMANGMAFESAVAASPDVPGLGIGVHLNLTQGQPVCLPSQIPSIVASGSRFYPSPGVLAWRVLTRRVTPGDVERELRGQIEKIASTGVRITHLDSHKHIHLLPPIFELVARLALEYGIGCVRCPIETGEAALLPLQSGRKQWPRKAKQYLLGRALSTLSGCQVKKLELAGLCSPDRFYGLSQTGFMDTRTLEGVLRAVSGGTNEMMCHPGYVDAALLKARTRLRTQREMELAALTSPGIQRLVADLGIELISYRGLPSAHLRDACKYNETVPRSISRV